MYDVGTAHKAKAIFTSARETQGTTLQGSEPHNHNVSMTVANARGYYDILGALSTFEVSQEVSLTHEELTQLAQEAQKESEGGDVQGKKTDGNSESGDADANDKDDDDERTPVHSYLGGRVKVKEAALASYDLGHTLLGGYVPQHQLESLSSIDFANYFRRTLENEDAVQIFDTFLPASSRTYMLPSTQAERDAQAGVEGSTATNAATAAAQAAENAANYERVLPDGKIVRKVVVCKRCNRKFRGIDRMKQLRKHECAAK